MSDEIVAKKISDALLGRTEALKELHDAKRGYAQRMLTTSIAMIPRDTAKMLDHAPHEELHIIAWKEYGWIIYTFIDQLQEDAITADGYGELARLIRFAREEKFDWLRLDVDASSLPSELGFQEFNW